ncbi:MAG: ABC transporter permease [Chloroflexi bacterium]|nr:ABC transporter permease [Chloroflexota bacterium]MBV9599017.1 ABC transporter permease [Chloroflexota bacterium]
MLVYILNRLAQSAIVLVLLSVVAFALVLLSGDPVSVMLPVHATEQDRLALEHEFGLDQPLGVQYFTFLGNVGHGDLGRSIKFDQPVLPLVISKLPLTLVLAITACAIAVLIGIPLGILTGVRPNGVGDVLGSVFALAFISVPSFWLGLILILFVGDYLRLLPVGGSGDVQHLILPALTLALPSIGLITRLTRSSVLGEIRQPYVTTARAKGLAAVHIEYGHVLRNAMIPTITVVALQFGALLAGSVIVETVFAWPGAGWLLMQGVFARDVPLVRAMVLITGAAFLLINLGVDLSYRYLDPRIRL